MNKDQLQSRVEIEQRVHKQRILVEQEIRDVKSVVRGRPHDSAAGPLQKELCVRLKPLATACYKLLAELRGKCHMSEKTSEFKSNRVAEFTQGLV